MLGFICKTGEAIDHFYDNVQTECKGEMIKAHITIDDFYIERCTIDKFLDDKLFYKDEDYLIVTEGVTLNRLSLMKEYKVDDWKKCVILLYETFGEDFFKLFRGPFCGIFVDLKKATKIVYTNQTGEKQVFYSKIRENYIFSTSLTNLAEYLKRYNIERTLDKNGAYCLITQGYMLEDITLFKEIKKLLPGHYAKITEDGFEIKRYHQFNYEPVLGRTEEEIIDELDMLFLKAVKLEFEKDKEYGYKHLVQLSGGLDSRMVNFAANELGYSGSILNVTCSQKDYWDATVPKKIACDLGHKWSFRALDGGDILRDIDRQTRVRCGTIIYHLGANAHVSMENVCTDHFGVLHTGMMGDAIVRSLVKTYPSAEFTEKRALEEFCPEYAYCTLLKLSDYFAGELKDKYTSQEEFYLRNTNFIGQSEIASAHIEPVEMISPFMDIEFLQFCLQIPLELRIGNNLRIKWINRKYPKAANYIYNWTNAKINEKQIRLGGKDIPYTRVPRFLFVRALRKISPELADTMVYNSMHTKHFSYPYDYWYRTNPNIRSELDNYYKENIDLLQSDEILMNNCKMIYTQGEVTPKTQVLTLLSMVKQYFN